MDDPRARFFDLSNEMLCIATFEGRFEVLNPAWARTLGWSEAELTSRPFLDFVHPDDLERTVREASALASGERTTVGFLNRYRCVDGSWKWLKWTSTIDAEARRFYAVATDVTALVESKDLLEARIADLRRWDEVPERGARAGTGDRLRRLRAELESVRAHLNVVVSPARPPRP